MVSRVRAPEIRVTMTQPTPESVRLFFCFQPRVVCVIREPVGGFRWPRNSQVHCESWSGD